MKKALWGGVCIAVLVALDVESAMARLIGMADADGDGQLSREEAALALGQLTRRLGLPVPVAVR